MHDLIRYFTFEHLPVGPLQDTSSEFHTLAIRLDVTLPPCAEKTVALRKLLEAKDAAVRAALDTPPNDERLRFDRGGILPPLSTTSTTETTQPEHVVTREEFGA